MLPHRRPSSPALPRSASPAERLDRKCSGTSFCSPRSDPTTRTIRNLTADPIESLHYCQVNHASHGLSPNISIQVAGGCAMVGFAKLDTFVTEGVPSSPCVMQRRRFLTCLGAAAMASTGPAFAQTPQAKSAGGKRIDVHHHFLPPAYMKEEQERVNFGHSIPPSQMLAWSVTKPLDMMLRMGIPTGCVSVPSPGVGFVH